MGIKFITAEEISVLDLVDVVQKRSKKKKTY